MAPGILPGLFISARRLASEERFATETISVPLLTLFALKALLDLEALNSNNVRGGTCLAEAGGAKKSGWLTLWQHRAFAVPLHCAYGGETNSAGAGWWSG